MPHSPTPRPTVVIVGGGYAGAIAANRLAGAVGRRARIVLISDRDDLVHRVRLHEVAATGQLTRYPLDGLLRRRVERLRARVIRIDATAGTCLVREPDGIDRWIGYDHLVYAVGSGIGAAAPGAREHGHALASPETALAFAERLRGLPDGAAVAVIGGGLTGLETASELAEVHPRLRVTIYGDVLGPGLDARSRAALAEGLAELGVTVRLGVRVAAVRADEIELATGERAPAAATVWAAGLTASPLARDSGLPVDVHGRLELDGELRATGLPTIWGCGDAVTPPVACVGHGEVSLRMACATALPTACHVADNLADLIRGRGLRTFRFGYFVQCISLGRRRGVITFCDADDRPTGRVITGRTGAMIKELICRYPIGAIRLERRFTGSYFWPGRLARRRMLAHAEPAALPAGDTRVA